MFRRRANKRSDRKYFSKTAGRTHIKNVKKPPMRGGFRI